MRSNSPIAYSPAFETVRKDEVEAIRTLQNAFATSTHRLAEARGHACRAVHAKGHAILRGTLTVIDGLPADYAQGLFAAAGRYGVLLRWSSPPAGHLPDGISTPRAVALKLLEVPGERLEQDRPGRSQDFLLVNAPAFALPDPQSLLLATALLPASAEGFEGGKKAFSAVMRGVEGAIEALGGMSVKIKGIGGEPQRHPLGETYYSQTPFLYGPYMAKFALAPVSASLLALGGVKLGSGDDAQREALAAHFAEQGGEWELRVQLCTDLDRMPLEDASKEWPQELSPYVAVARLVLDPQQSWDPVASPRLEDEMAFDPWNCVAAHRPLGAINRARREVMKVSREVRASFNRCPIHEPSGD
ncbi:catalase family protein [Massilia sp. BSC265]|uniref:catalase family protein n=1 Tax=Massilia sp. BSC265 TaxID=1549812 RepID=UPI0004E93E44|nr:catalase family protein [Massilia sp. BSC265]KFI08252.1 catalase [Massilia sp. BSC265]